MTIVAPRFFYLETYGCSANQNNSEIISGILTTAGLSRVSKPELADISIINTCIVKAKTEEKIKHRIKELAENKKEKYKIIVAGCMPEIPELRKQLQQKNIYFLGTRNLKKISSLVRSIFENKYNEDKFLIGNEIKLNLPKIPENKIIGITQISEGCLGDCNYCIVKLAKGRLTSYPQDMIIESIKKDLQQGCKEIWLTSQDNANYGLEKGKRELPELLNKILKLKGNFKIRLGMMDPNNVLPILEELIELYKHEKMFKFLHLPLQSGSNKILKEMNRQYQ